MGDIKVTIFTPTHNRGYIINRCYESICRQTCKDFEWIIVNDASTDQTDQIVNQWIDDNRLSELKYVVSRENIGIAQAMNMAIKQARGILFFKVDDDDVLREDAIEKILEYEATIINKEDFAGVSGLRCYPDGHAIGHEWLHKAAYIDATNLERKKYQLGGDKAEAYYTAVLKKYGPFPTFDGEAYAFPGILWNRIANAGLKIRWFPEKIYICDYLPDGITSNFFKTCKKNFNAYSYMTSKYNTYKKAYFMEKFVATSKYFAVAFAKGIDRKNLPVYFVWKQKWLWAAYIYGWCIYRLRILLKPKKYGKDKN